jgi:uncharacterized membrane protein
MTSALMAFLHHLAAFTLTGSIIYELVAFHKDLTLAEASEFNGMISSTASLPELF